MNRTILLLTFCFSMVVSTYSQTSITLRYNSVTEFQFDYGIEDYKENGQFEVSGAISIDPIKVFIKGYNNQQDKTLKIIKKQKEEGTERDMYLCEMDGNRYAIAISPYKKYLTVIGVDDKYIYGLKKQK